jgi:hypothetical protein
MGERTDERAHPTPATNHDHSYTIICTSTVDWNTMVGEPDGTSSR